MVNALGLPQCYIAAGYIRNYVWDRLHGFEDRAKHEDIDVVYYDPVDCSESRDRSIENAIIELTGNKKWSFKNQARMHIRNGEAPYSSTVDALRRWPETVTAIGVRLNDTNTIDLCIPYGLEDLFSMTVRQSPLFTDTERFHERISKKNWKQHWPLITIMPA
jgi:hypothetical protein